MLIQKMLDSFIVSLLLLLLVEDTSYCRWLIDSSVLKFEHIDKFYVLVRLEELNY